MRIEPGPGGWPLESFTVNGNEHWVQMGYTLAWEAPHRLLLQWRAVYFAPHEHTEVAVPFQASGTGTMVTATHRGWAATRVRPSGAPRLGDCSLCMHDGLAVG